MCGRETGGMSKARSGAYAGDWHLLCGTQLMPYVVLLSTQQLMPASASGARYHHEQPNLAPCPPR